MTSGAFRSRKGTPTFARLGPLQIPSVNFNFAADPGYRSSEPRAPTGPVWQRREYLGAPAAPMYGRAARHTLTAAE